MKGKMGLGTVKGGKGRRDGEGGRERERDSQRIYVA
jgi:hypothetical protein